MNPFKWPSLRAPLPFTLHGQLLEPWSLRTLLGAFLSSSAQLYALSQLLYICHYYKVLYNKVHPGSYPSSKHLAEYIYLLLLMAVGGNQSRVPLGLP